MIFFSWIGQKYLSFVSLISTDWQHSKFVLTQMQAAVFIVVFICWPLTLHLQMSARQHARQPFGSWEVNVTKYWDWPGSVEEFWEMLEDIYICTSPELHMNDRIMLYYQMWRDAAIIVQPLGALLTELTPLLRSLWPGLEKSSCVRSVLASKTSCSLEAGCVVC